MSHIDRRIVSVLIGILTIAIYLRKDENYFCDRTTRYLAIDLVLIFILRRFHLIFVINFSNALPQLNDNVIHLVEHSYFSYSSIL